MKKVYGYIRVSTERQGVKGVSLEEQKDAIERYSKQNNLPIIRWFEERVTAAKSGRPAFSNMISLLRAGSAAGVIIHKIDRSARNLRDWADLVDLSDQGVEIHFVNESIDMAVRGGRLSADIQAVVAADYIRNLREETIKGLRGRLKQGFYPMRAPIGYLDAGGGKAKEIDPIKAPLIRKLFNKYASGEYTLKTLLKLARNCGLTNVKGGDVSLGGLSNILNNPFYTGIIYIRRTGESFAGKHEPIVSRKVFDSVQQVLRGKTTKGSGKHDFLFRRLFTCAGCHRSLIGEKQKGNVYYRCHLCPGISVNEKIIKSSVKNVLKDFKLNSVEMESLKNAEDKALTIDQSNTDIERKALTLELGALDTRLSKLTDVLIDETIDRETYLKKKNQLIHKMQIIKEKLTNNSAGLTEEQEAKAIYLELYRTAYLDYSNKALAQKRQVLKKISSNRIVEGKKVIIELNSPFRELCELKNVECGAPYRGSPRTGNKKKSSLETFQKKLEEWIEKPLSGEYTQSP